MGGGFPLDLILFGMIAVFLVLRLRGILGRRTGYERPTAERPRGGPVEVPGMARVGPVVDAKAEPAMPVRPLPAADSPVAATLQQMEDVDGSFTAAHFMAGAEGAFRMIVDAFARGDRDTLRPLLDDATYASFEAAITARETAGETQRSEVRAVERATIEDAALDGSMAQITVKFVSDQIAETVGKDGKPVAGADAVTEITDLWSFARDLRQPDPAWRLTAARSG